MSCRAVLVHCTSVLQSRRALATSCHVHRLSSAMRTRRWLSTSAAPAAAPKISMALVKQLREQSGAPITECKEAVAAATTSAGHDSPDLLSLATDILRKRGVSTASKKAGRVASEGLVSVAVSADRKRGVLVEMNSETDFAARNERFQSTLQQLAATALTAVQPATLQSTEQAESESEAALQSLLSASSEGKLVKEVMADTVSALRENIQLRRVAALAVDGEGVVGSYVHNAVAAANSSPASSTRLGRTATLVALSFKPGSSSSSSSSDNSSLVSLANKLAMQITAAPPTFLSRHHIPPATLQHEQSILAEQSKAKAADTSSRPGQPAKAAKPVDAKQLERIVSGRLNKYYEEVCLLDQLLVVNVGDGEAEGGGGVGKVRVSGMLSEEGKRRGGVLEVTGFVRYAVGEGVKKQEGKLSFADEVASKLSK